MTNSGINSQLTTHPVYSSYPPLQADGHEAKGIKIGSTLLGFYVFLLAGRLLDVSPIWWLHIPLLILIVLIVTTLTRGQLQYTFHSKIARYFTAFTIWVFVCFPFSYWRGHSKEYIQYQVQSFVIFLIIVQMVRTKQDWQKVVGGFAYATLVAALLAFHFGYTLEGRLALPGGTLADPNGFALQMVAGLPFWWFKASRAKGLRKVFFLCCTLPIFLAFAKAGSRAGLLAMAVLMVVSFIFARGVQKLVIVMTAVIAIAASTFLLPGYIQTRFKTFFSAGSSSNNSFSAGNNSNDSHLEARIDSDIASSNERKALLIQSIQMTFEHPIVGVGPGCFGFVAADERRVATGFGGESLVSHNTYTQISSETGIPGFTLFFIVVFLCVRSVIVDYRRLALIDIEFAQYARYLFSCMAALAVGIFFLSVGYTHMTATIFAFALALHNVVESKLKEAPGDAPAITGWQRLPNALQRSQPQYQNRESISSSVQQPVRSRLRPRRYAQVSQPRQSYRRIGPESSQ